MEFLTQLIFQAAGQVWITFSHNWPFLIISTLVAVSLKQFFDPQKISGLLTRYQGGGVLGATLLAIGTPLCSCGTTAVVLGMMASMVPWAPIIAFMVSSPLTSPEELVYSAGLFGWPFALAFFFSSIFLGLLGGAAGWYFESRGWLKNQARFQNSPTASKTNRPADNIPFRPVLTTAPIGGEGLCCPAAALQANSGPASPVFYGNTGLQTDSITMTPAQPGCSCNPAVKAEKQKDRVDWKSFLAESWNTGRRLLLMFLGFAFIGYLLNGLIPAEWVAAIFGKGNIYSVPLAATLGLPLYINSEASLPLVRALIDGGMSQGAAMAFLITGAGTSIGAVMGALTIARWRVLALVITTLWVGAIAAGFIFNLLLVSGIL